MDVIVLEAGFSISELLLRRAFWKIISFRVEWIFLNVDLGTIENIRFALPSNALIGALQAKITSLPMCEKVYPSVDAIIIPAVEGVVETVSCKLAELQRISEQEALSLEAIGEKGVSIADPAGLNSEGTIQWAFMFEDDLFAFFPQEEQDKVIYAQELTNLGMNFQYAPRNNFDLDTNWISKMQFANKGKDLH